jgi:6-phosphogluconolactonase
MLRLFAKPRLVLACAALAACAVAGDADAKQELGANIHQSTTTGPDATRDATLGWVRVDMNWLDIEHAQGQLDFTLLDAVVDAAVAHNLKVLAVLAYTPAWASSGDTKGDGPNNDVPIAGAYAAFVTAAVNHFKNRVTHYEIWNEPNLSVFFEGTPAQYTSLILVPGADAVHAACATCSVVGPALASIAGMYDVWLDAALTAAKDKIDIISGHAYAGFPIDDSSAGTTSDSFFNKLDAHRIVKFGTTVVYEGPLSYREVMVKHAVTAPFWMTETGLEAAYGDLNAEASQTRFYRHVLEAMLTRPWWTATIFYEAFDEPNTGHTFGICLHDPSASIGYDAKPVMDLLKKAIAEQPAFGGNGTDCEDGLDNDGDGLIDYPADPDCTSATSTSEGLPPSPDAGVDAGDMGDGGAGDDGGSNGASGGESSGGCSSSGRSESGGGAILVAFAALVIAFRRRRGALAFGLCAMGCGGGDDSISLGPHDAGSDATTPNDAGDGAATDASTDGTMPPSDAADAAPMGPLFAYASGYAPNIDVYSVDPSSGALTPKGNAASFGSSPSFLAVNPTATNLYAPDENATGRVGAYAIDHATGALTFLNSVSSTGNGPAFVGVYATGAHVFVANYGDGTVAVLPVQAGGKLGAATDSQNVGANAHMIVADPSGQFVFVPCKGADYVAQFHFDATMGKLTANATAHLATPAGSGPRHIAFHPTGKLAYLISETSSTMTALSLDTTNGTLSIIETKSTLPAGFTGTNTGAEVWVHPSGRFVYGSNRGDDSIVVFSIDQMTGKMTLVAHTKTGGTTPRDFTIDPTGAFLYAANQGSGTVVPFKIDANAGTLTPTATSINVASASFIGVVRFP